MQIGLWAKQLVFEDGYDLFPMFKHWKMTDYSGSLNHTSTIIQAPNSDQQKKFNGPTVIVFICYSLIQPDRYSPRRRLQSIEMHSSWPKRNHMKDANLNTTEVHNIKFCLLLYNSSHVLNSYLNLK